jgi:hypothetical protein
MPAPVIALRSLLLWAFFQPTVTIVTHWLSKGRPVACRKTAVMSNVHARQSADVGRQDEAHPLVWCAASFRGVQALESAFCRQSIHEAAVARPHFAR